jgi:hypothetical protein
MGSFCLCPSFSLAGLVPLGALGSVEFTLATLPLISNQYIELDINVSGMEALLRLRHGCYRGQDGVLGQGPVDECPKTLPCLLPASTGHCEGCSW